MTRLVLSELFVTNLPVFEHQQKNCSLADSFLDPMAELSKYSSDWRKDVINWCLEFALASSAFPSLYCNCKKQPQHQNQRRFVFLPLSYLSSETCHMFTSFWADLVELVALWPCSFPGLFNIIILLSFDTHHINNRDTLKLLVSHVYIHTQMI